MSKKQEALKIKAEKELAAENQQRLQAKMQEIALREQKAEQDKQDKKAKELAEKKRKEQAIFQEDHRRKNAAFTQAYQILHGFGMSSTPQGLAFIKARDAFIQVMIDNKVSVPALNLLK